MRAFNRILGAVAALGLVAMAGPAALAQGKINVGYVTASDFVPLLVAKEKGFFEKRGLDVEPKRISHHQHSPRPRLRRSADGILHHAIAAAGQ